MTYLQGKGYIDSAGRKVATKRQMQLWLARSYGYENDSEAYARLVIERGRGAVASFDALRDAWRAGAALRLRKTANA